MHTATADFAFGGEAFTGVFGDFTGLTEGLGDEFCDPLRVGVPGFDARRAVDANDSIGAHTQVAEFFGNADGFTNVVYPIGASGSVTASRSVEPYRSDNRAYHQTLGFNLGGERFNAVIGDIDVGVRIVQKQVDAVEFDAADFGFGGHIEHRVEADKWLGAGTAFADQTWPGRIVEFREVIFSHGNEGI